MKMIPIELQLLRSSPKSNQIVLRQTLGPCDGTPQIRVEESASAVSIDASAPLRSVGAALVNGQIVGTACQAVGTAKQVSLVLKHDLGSRSIFVNDLPVEEAGS